MIKLPGNDSKVSGTVGNDCDRLVMYTYGRIWVKSMPLSQSEKQLHYLRCKTICSRLSTIVFLSARLIFPKIDLFDASCAGCESVFAM